GHRQRAAGRLPRRADRRADILRPPPRPAPPAPRRPGPRPRSFAPRGGAVPRLGGARGAAVRRGRRPLHGAAGGFPQSRRPQAPPVPHGVRGRDRKSTRLNSSHVKISYAVFCLKKKIKIISSVTYISFVGD